MSINEGRIDRFARILVGAIVIATGLFYQSWWGAIGAIPLITGAVGFCPLYTLFGLNTCENKMGRT